MWQTLPDFGTGVLYAILVAAAYTFAVAVAAGQGQPRLLRSARLAAYGTSALVLLGVLLLAYAFVTHDFRIRYVARYSDRSMSTTFLLTSLWGGQDGSLLWWLFLLSAYVSGCVKWMKNRYRELQPYVIATLMTIVGFFTILMLFAANPFETSIAGARIDGEGLEPLLQNIYMVIHPPSLYMGFVGCSVPFAFAVAALVSGRLDSEWIVAVRKWMLFAWLFLSIGNALGMLWAYEELGWGGEWAWDPVENAACLPWFTATAYVHSTMIQERRQIFKVWNLVLIGLTFFLTIFGTFLTRAGIVSSVHSFAQSDIGVFFVWFMAVIVATMAGLIVLRYPKLRAKGSVESPASREAMFVVNNWVLLAGGTFILCATMYPKLTEWMYDEAALVGPPFFNRWMAPIGITLFALMGIAPLFGWRKTSSTALRKAFTAPLVALVTVASLHLTFGKSMGFPAIVEAELAYDGVAGWILKMIGQAAPLVVVSLAGFNLAVIVQEFVRGVRARRRSNDGESVLGSLLRLVEKNRRRYGGYIVHTGIIAMFLGFTGRAWSIDKEAVMSPGDQFEIGAYTLTYEGPRTEVDMTKRAVYADLSVKKDGKPYGRVNPAKFIYPTRPEAPTTEVSMLHSVREDLYTVVGVVNPMTKKATFQFHVNPLKSWLWGGVLILILGASISLWPEVSLQEVSAWSYAKTGAGVAAGAMFAFVMTSSATQAHATVAPARAPPRHSAAEVFGPATAGMWAAPALGIGIGIGSAGWLRRRRRK